MMANKRRVYEELRAIVENEGGEMYHERRGHVSGGAWVVELCMKQRVFHADGRGYLALASYYVPLRDRPIDASHYSNHLIDDAKVKWLNVLK